jgi:hypothetical protein
MKDEGSLPVLCITAHMQDQQSTRQTSPLCSRKTSLMGWLPWCDSQRTRAWQVKSCA